MSEASDPPAGWYEDPSKRHEQRYWGGTEWTDHVADNGVAGVDPLGARAGKDLSSGAEGVAALQQSQDPRRRAIAAVLEAKLGGPNRHFVRKEIRRLPDLMEPDEKLVTAASGRYDGRNGLLAITDRRILFLEDGLMRKQVEEFHYGRVSSIQWQSGMLASGLTIITSGNKATIENVMPKERASDIAGYVSKRISGHRDELPVADKPEPTASAPSTDPISQLKQLAELRDSGVLTDSEFELKKAELLKRL